MPEAFVHQFFSVQQVYRARVSCSFWKSDARACRLILFREMCSMLFTFLLRCNHASCQLILCCACMHCVFRDNCSSLKRWFIIGYAIKAKLFNLPIKMWKFVGVNKMHYSFICDFAYAIMRLIQLVETIISVSTIRSGFAWLVQTTAIAWSWNQKQSHRMNLHFEWVNSSFQTISNEILCLCRSPFLWHGFYNKILRF